MKIVSRIGEGVFLRNYGKKTMKGCCRVWDSQLEKVAKTLTFPVLAGPGSDQAAGACPILPVHPTTYPLQRSGFLAFSFSGSKCGFFICTSPFNHPFSLFSLVAG